MNIRIKNYRTSWTYRFRIRETILWFMNLLFSWRSGVSVSSALKVVLMKNANQMVIFIFIFRIKMSTLKKSTDVINVALFQKLFWTTVRNNFLVIYKNLSMQIQGWRPRIHKLFEIKTLCLSSESSKQFLKQNTFFTCYWNNLLLGCRNLEEKVWNVCLNQSYVINFWNRILFELVTI